jgi:hypothetical protein
MCLWGANTQSGPGPGHCPRPAQRWRPEDERVQAQGHDWSKPADRDDDGCAGRHEVPWGEAANRRVRESSDPPSAMRTGRGLRRPWTSREFSPELRQLRKYGVTGARATPSLTPSSHVGQRHAQARFPWSPSSIPSRVKASQDPACARRSGRSADASSPPERSADTGPLHRGGSSRRSTQTNTPLESILDLDLTLA